MGSQIGFIDLHAFFHSSNHIALVSPTDTCWPSLVGYVGLAVQCLGPPEPYPTVLEVMWYLTQASYFTLKNFLLSLKMCFVFLKANFIVLFT